MRRYGELRAVDGLDLDVRVGECVGVLGPNGAGKSTTMRMLSCLAPRDDGELEVLGLDPERAPRALKRRLGVVAQETTLDLELSVRENLVVYARYFGIPRDVGAGRAEALLDLMALRERADEPVDRLSGGMRRRLQIARALVNEPDLVLLDEPTTGLDPQARHAVWERLRLLASRGATLVLTTHYMEEAARLCDRVAVVDRGRVIREGAPQALVRAEAGREALELRVAPAEIPAALAAAGPAARGHQTDGDLLVLFADDARAVLDAIRRAGVGARLQAARPADLEDVFLRLTGRRLR